MNKPTHYFFTLAQLAFLLLLSACQASKPGEASSQIRKDIAQKIMIDIRYFCGDQPYKKHCQQPVTELPDTLKNMIVKHRLGGVILFADNLQNAEQILKLNHDLQRAATSAAMPPLYLAIDQEGGRVVRLPNDFGTSFAGNMAIGATWNTHGDRYARQTGRIIAQELKLLGFNLNFAPTVDVNVNPDNPVINVRSYSEDPVVVAALGTAQMQAMQRQGMITALKHFPGHGDTNVDSHTGLPRVDHNRNTVEKVDLVPFKHAIGAGAEMIMTAHIQYPSLDNSEFVAKDGTETILPATMSRKILHDLLRQDMGFDGIVVTDALEMAGVANYFDQTQAVIQTFKAGADIALMPYAIRSNEDLKAFEKMLDELVQAVMDGELDRAEISQSAERIMRNKAKYKIGQFVKTPLEDHKLAVAAYQRHNQSSHTEQSLADASVVQVKNSGVLPLQNKPGLVQLFMPDQARCEAMLLSLQRQLPRATFQCASLANRNILPELSRKPLVAVILVDISPQQSLAEMGGMDDLQHYSDRADVNSIQRHLIRLAHQSRQRGIGTVFISMRAPYVQADFDSLVDAQLAVFSYTANKSPQGEVLGGPIFKALAKVISGKLIATGNLPVSLEAKNQP